MAFLVGGFFKILGREGFFLVECCFWFGGFFKNYGSFSCPILQYPRRPICVRLELLTLNIRILDSLIFENLTNLLNLTDVIERFWSEKHFKPIFDT